MAVSEVNPREERGRAIAERCKITKVGDRWKVPSQSNEGSYTVKFVAGAMQCTCPDYETRQTTCKHCFAVQFTLTKVEQHADGSTTVETLAVKATRKTYRQPDWALYNAHQVNERRHFLDLLGDLCDTIPAAPAKQNSKGGRPAIPVRDAIYSAVFKCYSLTSARRFSGELAEVHERGYIGKCPHFNTVLDVFDKEETTPILRRMVETSAAPLASVESKFAVDSTGFTSTKYQSWFDSKWGTERRKAVWQKAHFLCGTTTNTVAAVQVLDFASADGTQMPGLMDTAAKTFKVNELSADSAYCWSSNFEAVEKHGGTFFPAFRSNTTGGVGGSFARAFHFFQFEKERYLAHYHARSNAETVVSMIKAKFGEGLRTKNERSQQNECYAKFVCHNVCVLIAEMYALGIEAVFARPGCTTTETPAQILRFPGRM
jgi:transposase